MLLTQHPNLYIIHSDLKGRGVFCTDDIAAGSTIEICMLIIFSEKDSELIHQTQLHDYYFVWDEAKNTSAITLGYGSLYNHSSKPNAETESLMDTEEIRFTAIKDIPAGEEITINYLGDSKEADAEIWFDVVN